MLEWEEEYYSSAPELNEVRELIDAEIARRLREYFENLDGESK